MGLPSLFPIKVRLILTYHLAVESGLVQMFSDVIKYQGSFHILPLFLDCLEISQIKQKHLQIYISSFKAKGIKNTFTPETFFFKSERQMFSISTPNRSLLTHHWTERIAGLSLIQHLIKRNVSTKNGLDGSWFIPFIWHLVFECMRGCSIMSDSVTPWTIAHQAPLSMEFSRYYCLEYWSRLSFPTPGNLPTQESKSAYPGLVGGFFNTWEAHLVFKSSKNKKSFFHQRTEGKVASLGNYQPHFLSLILYLEILLSYYSLLRAQRRARS